MIGYELRPQVRFWAWAFRLVSRIQGEMQGSIQIKMIRKYMFTAYVWSTVNSKGEIGMYFVSNITFITIESPLNSLAVKSGDFF